MKRFRKLRGKLVEAGITQQELGYHIGRNYQSVNARMNDRLSWSLAEMYQTLDLLHIPHDQLHIYFPKDGKDPS